MLFDFTSLGNTVAGSIGQEGTAAEGVDGWIPKAVGWQVSDGKVIHSSASETTGNLIYRPDFAAQSHRIAVQVHSLTGSGFACFGVYNPASGKAIRCRWTLNTASSLSLKLYSDTDGTPPAGSLYTLPGGAAPAVYSDAAATDWAVMTVVAQRHSYAVTVAVYADNGSNAPDLASSPKTTLTSQFLNREFEEAGFTLCPFLGPSGEGGSDHYWSRCVLYEVPQFTCDVKAAAPGQRVTVALAGKHTNWDKCTNFRVTSSLGGGAKVLQQVTGPTEATIVLDAPPNCTTLTIDDGATSQLLIVNPEGVAYDARTVWVTGRSTQGQSFEPYTGFASAGGLKPANGGILYSVTPDYAGTRLYWLETNGFTSKSGLTPAAASDIALLSTTPSSPRKALGLPDGSMLVFSSNGPNISRFDAGDAYQGVWGSVPALSGYEGAYAGCLFKDPTRENELTVLVSNFSPSAPNVHQFDLSGNYLKLWATGPNTGRAADLQFDGAGHVYILDWTTTGPAQGNVWIWSASGEFVGTFTHPNLINPYGICVLKSGEILIACENKTHLAVFAPGGHFLGLAVGGNQAFNGSMVDVNVVPE